jgi:hypothetical protein
MSHVTEVVLFRLNEGVQESEFLADAQATFDLIKNYDGYIHRELSVTEDGLWTDIVTWRDMQTAMTAANQLMNDPIGQKFGAHIDMATLQMNHTHLKLATQK